MTEHDLMDRPTNFRFDTDGVSFTFSQRLARENGWSDSYTSRVLDEYKRFLFLACEAGHPVTPSDQVDQAWHLHLTYTHSYWNELCDGVLKKKIHHGPTQGGVAEQTKFRDWYSETLRSYEKVFAEPVPADIWPSPDRRFATTEFRRVDLGDNFLINRSKTLRNANTAAIGAGLLAIAGCTTVATTAGSDWTGWVVLAVLALFVFGCVLVYWVNGGGRGGGSAGGDSGGGGCGGGCGGCGGCGG